MNRRAHITICLTLLMIPVCALLLPSEASCRLSGDAEFGYVNYGSSANNQSISANSLTQQYSVLFEKSGKLADGRLGKYDVTLGYQWLTFDSSIKSGAAPASDASESKGKINYQGELLINPKELPFRLSLFSRDLNRINFSTGGAASVIDSLSTGTGGYVALPSGIAAGITGGQRLEAGATLVMGVKNGMTNGYNEILRHFPMVMLDYSHATNLNRASEYPVDNKLSRLAFVSLNKKENWFHYRNVTYSDNIDNSNDYTESQFQLGTVDHRLQRRWVDFSNWLSVSVDGQLTKREEARSSENFEEFNLNLFGTARRQSWELRTFNNFMRLNEFNKGEITYKTSLPLYVNGVISPTAGWSAHAKYDNTHNDAGSFFTTATSGYTINSFQKSPFALQHNLSVEQVAASGGSDSLILTGNISTNSTPLFSRKVSINAGYSISNYRSSAANVSTGSTGQVFNAGIAFSPLNQVRISVDQTSRLTTGKATLILSDLSGAAINSSQPELPLNNSSSDTSSSGYDSTTTIKITWAPKPRLNIGFSVSENLYIPASGRQSATTAVNTTLNYTGSNLKISSSINYNSGDVNSSTSSQTLTNSNDISYAYAFSRNLDAKVGLNYIRTFGAQGQTYTLNLQQSLNYTYHQSSGFGRTLFQINESFVTNEESAGTVSSLGTVATKNKRDNTLTLGTKYFPFKNMPIAGGARYHFVDSIETGSVNYYGSISLQFKLLSASLEYTYGKTRADNKVDKRIMANLKKKF